MFAQFIFNKLLIKKFHFYNISNINQFTPHKEQKWRKLHIFGTIENCPCFWTCLFNVICIYFDMVISELSHDTVPYHWTKVQEPLWYVTDTREYVPLVRTNAYAVLDLWPKHSPVNSCCSSGCWFWGEFYLYIIVRTYFQVVQ